MVKREIKSLSEVDEDPQLLNENGKRPANDQSNEGKKKIKIKNLFRQPTVNELNRLQETETLFNSNLFRLQVEEILQEVKIKEKTEKKFENWFKTFTAHLDTIPEDEKEYDLSEPNFSKKIKVKLPFSDKLTKTKCVFKFHKHSSVDIIGSYALGCAINSKLCIDIQITVPSETYTKNDSINYRYHKKKSAYMAYIAAHLTKLDSIEELKYTWLNGCETKPVLDIKPTGKLANHFTVRLHLACEAEAYKFHRFSPTRNNLRETWLFGGESQENKDVGPPTPFYNSTVLSDLTASYNHHFLKETFSNAENLRQAIILLKIWLQQRRLQLSGHVISLYVAYLVQTKRINNIMSSYQIVRNVWIAMKTAEWDTKGISLYKGDNTPPLTDFTNKFSAVFLDTTGYYNLCADMSKGTYEALKRECTLAVEMLDNTKINSFISLFMVPVKPLTQFDYILQFKNMPNIIESIISRASKETRLNYGIDQLTLVTESLLTLLAKGLGDRVELIQHIVEAEFSWSVKKSPKKAKEKDGFQEKISFGFILHPENAFNVVQKGPSANLPEAEEFRAFWGDKSELRRFQDGAITETCVWEGETIAERRTVTKQIIDYLLQLKYGIPTRDLFYVCSQLDSVCISKSYVSGCEDSSAEALAAFDRLRNDLRTLTNLPLEISAVYGISPVFSYCDPLPPTPHAPVRRPWQRGNASLVKHITREDGSTCVPEYTPVIRAVIELGHSGKWPGSLEALRCVKAAFHQELAKRVTSLTAAPAQAYPTHFDILKDGYVFRLEIAHPKEITLLRRSMNNGVARYSDTDESIALHTRTALLPRLRGALHGLHQKHPAFGPTTCLVKRWLCCHLLSSHFPAEVAELLTAAVFVQPAPLTPPASPLAGLMRVLTKLYQTDWRTEMVVLDFNEDMKREEIAELEHKFTNRSSFPPLAVVTAYDGEYPSVWSRHVTERALLRAQVLAKAAVEFLEKSLLKEMKENVLAMFVPSLSGYDVLIHLHSSCVPHHEARVDGAPLHRDKPGQVAADVIPVVEFHPVKIYLDELTSAFSDFALFFHDAYGGDVIAVLWKPDIKDDKEFQLSNAHALTRIQDGGRVTYKVNTDAIIQDFRIMGAGLVRDITVL